MFSKSFGITINMIDVSQTFAQRCETILIREDDLTAQVMQVHGWMSTV